MQFHILVTHPAYDMFSLYNNLIGNLFFPTLVFGVGFLLFVPFPVHCLKVHLFGILKLRIIILRVLKFKTIGNFLS